MEPWFPGIELPATPHDRLRLGVRRQAKRDAVFKQEGICKGGRLVSFESGVTAAALQDAGATTSFADFCAVAVQVVESCG